MSRSNKKAVIIIFFAWFAYMISYIGRADYGSCLNAILSQTGSDRLTAGMVSSAFALCNAIGQVMSGFIVRKISPVKLIGIELFSVAGINILMPQTDSFAVMAVIWGINGAMQSTLLCSATQIFAETLEEPYLSRGVVTLNTVGAIGGMSTYLLSCVFIQYFNWRYMFFTVAALLALFGILWCCIMPKYVAKYTLASAADKKDTPQKQNVSVFKQIASYGTVFAIIAAFFVGLLRESILLWIPTYMKDVFTLSESEAAAITVFVPCFQACGALLGGKIGTKVKSLHFAACVAFACSGICLFLIRLFSNSNAIVTVFFFVVNAMSMTAALTFMLSLFPIRYFGRGQVAILVGIINFSVHVGDFVASSGIGWLSENAGWWSTLLVLAVIAVLACAICSYGGIVCKKQGTLNLQNK